jgi:hypothetical protein
VTFVCRVDSASNGRAKRKKRRELAGWRGVEHVSVASIFIVGIKDDIYRVDKVMFTVKKFRCSSQTLEFWAADEASPEAG